MNLKFILNQAKNGRPDLAAKNLPSLKFYGLISHPVRFLRVIKKYPHSSGHMFSIAELATYYRSYHEED